MCQRSGKDEIDACIRPLVAALNAGGFPTLASCCGHGKRTGRIVMHDGTEIEIHPFERKRAYRNWSTLLSVRQIEGIAA
jgi:hypothetical protein